MRLLNKVFLVAILVILIQSYDPSVDCARGRVRDDSTRSLETESLSGSMVVNISKSTSFLTKKASHNSETYILLDATDHSTCTTPDEECDLLQESPHDTATMKMETDIVVVTLNCWGIRFVSKDRVTRMNAIAEELATGKYDFVFLQEVWTTEDYERIKTRTGDVLPYSHYFFSGVIGAGICIFSKSPIKSAFFHQWAVNGYIHKIQHGDWFGGKGIGMVEVDHRGLHLNLYTAHLHAEYDKQNDEYIAHRVTQAFDTAQFIKMTSKSADAVIVGGDLNTEPGDLTYRLLFHTANLHDAGEEAEKKPSPELLNTSDTPRNTYAHPQALQANPHGKRIDYVAYKGGKSTRVKALSCQTPWPDRVPDQPFSYSDHEAVVCKLRISKSNTNVQPPSRECAKKEALEAGVEICSQAIKHLHSARNMYYLVSLAMMVILLSTARLEFQGFLLALLTALRVIILFILFFGIFMSVIWHRMEVHGILAGKLGMLLELGRPIEPDTEVLPEGNSLLSGTGTGNGEPWTPVDPNECIP